MGFPKLGKGCSLSFSSANHLWLFLLLTKTAKQPHVVCCRKSLESTKLRKIHSLPLSNVQVAGSRLCYCYFYSSPGVGATVGSAVGATVGAAVGAAVRSVSVAHCYCWCNCNCYYYSPVLTDNDSCRSSVPGEL